MQIINSTAASPPQIVDFSTGKKSREKERSRALMTFTMLSGSVAFVAVIAMQSVFGINWHWIHAVSEAVLPKQSNQIEDQASWRQLHRIQETRTKLVHCGGEIKNSNCDNAWDITIEQPIRRHNRMDLLLFVRLTCSTLLLCLTCFQHSAKEFFARRSQ